MAAPHVRLSRRGLHALTLLAACWLGLAQRSGPMRGDDASVGRCPYYDLGTVPAWKTVSSSSMRGSKGPIRGEKVLTKEGYYRELKHLDIEALYRAVEELTFNSRNCWPADGPQDGDVPSYAGLFGRLAWHCCGTFRLVDNDTSAAAGGCKGEMRYWPMNEWRDNTGLDKARGLLGEIKHKFGDQVSWGDLITFAGTVGIKASGGPAKKFCFGRVDEADGQRAMELGVQGTNECKDRDLCESNYPCETNFWWPEQDQADNFRCNLTQEDGRLQASHSVGLIYVYPEGPELKDTHPEHNHTWVHNRSPRLSALEVRDTFKDRMGWTDRETVALIGGGHTLGRSHGNCNLQGTAWADKPFSEEGPYYEAEPGSGRGPTDGTCGTGAEAGLGPNAVSSGFEGAWTRTPSQWNYDFFQALLDEEWVPVKSPYGNDQWQTADRNSDHANVTRLTADLALVADEIYRPIVLEYAQDHKKFDSDFADAWYKLVHRSADHPLEDDLEKDSGVCTHFEFLRDDDDDDGGDDDDD